MTVAARLTGFVDRMQTKQADLFVTTVTVTRIGTAGAFDEATATYVTASTTTIYTGAALVRPLTDAVSDAGDETLSVNGYTIKLPVGTDVRLGDIVTVTASVHDSSMVGMTLRVDEVHEDEWQIAQVCRASVQTSRPAT